MTFTCPRCGTSSEHPDDLAHGYCGRCHDFTAEPLAAADALLAVCELQTGTEPMPALLRAHRAVEDVYRRAEQEQQ